MAGEQNWTDENRQTRSEFPQGAEQTGSGCSAVKEQDAIRLAVQKHLALRSSSQSQSSTGSELLEESQTNLLGYTDIKEPGSVVSLTEDLQNSQNCFYDDQAAEAEQTGSSVNLQSSSNNNTSRNFIEDSVDENDRNQTIKDAVHMGVDEIHNVPSILTYSNNGGTSDQLMILSSVTKTEQTLHCPLCHEVFTDNQEWLVHHKSVHASMCSDCGRIFKSLKSLRLHVMTAHKQQTTGYFCKYCGKRFTQQHHYRGHIKSHHGIKEFHCEHCNQAFTYRSGLTVHMRKCGGLVGDYKCPICQKDFLKQCHLKEHISGMHSETPRYTCQSCGEKFLWRDALSRHKAKTCHK